LGTTKLEELKLTRSFLTQSRIMLLKPCPWGLGEATIGETVFTCASIGIFFLIFYLGTTEYEKLKFTWKLPDIAQNQVS
jgi:hypothetical protein